MKSLSRLAMVGVLFWGGISLGSDNKTKKSFSQELKRRCSQCELYVGKGKMLTPDGVKDVVFVLVADQGTELRVERRVASTGKDCVILYIPKGIRDIELEKFLKGVTKDVY